MGFCWQEEALTRDPWDIVATSVDCWKVEVENNVLLWADSITMLEIHYIYYTQIAREIHKCYHLIVIDK